MLHSDTSAPPAISAGMDADGSIDTAAGKPLRKPGLFSGPSAYAVQTPWQPFGGLLASTGIFIGATLAVLIAVAEAWLIIGLPHNIDFSHIITNTGMQLVATLIQQIVMIALTLWAAKSYAGSAHEVLALRKPAQGAMVYAGAFGLFLAAMIVMSQLSSLLAPGSNEADVAVFKGMFQSAWWPLALFVVGIGAPVSEELLFRGFLFPALAKTPFGLWGAAVSTSLIFSAVHGYSVAGFVEVFAIGMMLCWLLIRTGSLRVTMFAHALNNTVQAVLLLAGVENWL